jgi:hypothetical protein
VPDPKFDLTVGKLSPLLNDWQEAALWKLDDNLAGFATSGVERQRMNFHLLAVTHSVGKITRADEHFGTPKHAKPTVSYI